MGGLPDIIWRGNLLVTHLINEYGLLVVDGPLATELERRGCDLSDELWSARMLMERPELIRQVHLDYFRAGADVAITASYQASPQGFQRRGCDEAQALALITQSAQLAAEARDLFLTEQREFSRRPRPLIAGSIGSYGASLANGSEYTGHFDLSRKQLIDFHRPRMQALADHVDFLALETIPCLHEARALVDLLEEFPTLSAWICFSCRDGAHNGVGEPIEQVVAWLDRQKQIFAVGINCTHPRYLNDLLARMQGATGKPLVVYPNSGEAYDARSGCWTGSGWETFTATVLSEWYARGVRLIGGCCRTTPAMIRQVADWRAGLFSR